MTLELVKTTSDNLPAEQALLGMLLRSNDVMLELPRYLRAEHFSHATHAKLFEALQRNYREGRICNPITLKSEFENDPALKAEGGIQYLVKLVANAHGLNPVDYCFEIHQAWMKRELAQLCNATVTALLGDNDPSESASTLSEAAGKILADAMQSKIRTDYDIGVEILEDLKNQKKPYSTGLEKLDSAMGGGLFEKKLYGFAARKKVGKTILAATLSHNLAEQGVKHLFICAEMSAKEIHQRVLARVTDSFESAFRSDYGQTQQFQNKLAQAVTESKRCMLMEDKPGITFQELQQIIPVYAVRHGIKGFILDYWQLVGGKAKNRSTSEHLDEVAQWLATVCRKYGIWGVVMAQVNQEGNTRGSEGLRLAADQVYEIHREDLSNPYGWVEMMETRYTPWANIGSKDIPGIRMQEKGPYFTEES